MKKIKTIGSVATLSIVTACVYAYLYHSLAARSDIESQLVGTVVRQLLPDLRSPYSTLGAVNLSPSKGETKPIAGIPFTPVGSGMPGACEYFMLQKCIAFYLGAEVRTKPDVLYKFINIVSNMCGSIGESTGRDAASIPGMKKYFECDVPDNAKPIILISLVEGMDGEPRKEIFSDGGIRYSGRSIKTIYQLVVKN